MCLVENVQMASFVGPKTVVVNGVEYTADHINVAVGGRPIMPDVPGSEFCIDRQGGVFLFRCCRLFMFCRFFLVVLILSFCLSFFLSFLVFFCLACLACFFFFVFFCPFCLFY